jgi:hypothetical protein
MHLPRLSSQQQGVGVSKNLTEMSADIIVPIWKRPTTVDKTAIGIFGGATWRLDHAVQSNEFMNNYFSHVNSPVVDYFFLPPEMLKPTAAQIGSLSAASFTAT